jgi:protease II
MLNNIGVVYACKPYTDVLRTVTNKNLTQVTQESEEFGYVAEDPVGFMAIAKVSPYENVAEKPKRNPAVILTGGIKDPEVEVYMPVKFAKRLQDAGWRNTVLRIADEGHFTGSDSRHSEAHDAAMCEYFLSIKK